MPLLAESGFLDAIGKVSDQAEAAESKQQTPVQQQPEQTQANPNPEKEEDVSLDPPKAEETKEQPKSDKKGVDALVDDDESIADAPDDVKSDPKAKNAWSQIKSEKKELAAKVAELERKLSEASKLPESDPIKKQADEYKQKYEELEKEAAVWRIEKTEAWKNEVTKPLTILENSLKELAEATEVSPEAIAKVVMERDTKARRALIAELGDSMTGADLAQLQNIVSEAQKVFARRDELEENAAEALKELTERESTLTQQQKLEAKATEMREVEAIAEKLKKASSLFAVEDGKGESVVQEIIQNAQSKPFDEMNAAEKAFAIVASQGLPKMKEVIVALRKEKAALQDEIKALTGTRPSGGIQGNQKQTDDGLGFLASLDQYIK